jgi:hypothetical protein
VLGAFIVLGCSSDSAVPPASSRSSEPTTTTTSTLPPTTPATVPLAPAGSAQEAATTFINAWRDGNDLKARTIALAAAVDAVFGAGGPGSVQARGCNSPPNGSPVLCVYRTAVGEVQVRVQEQPDGWIVDQAIVSEAP